MWNILRTRRSSDKNRRGFKHRIRRLEVLEGRVVPSITIQFDFSYDNTGFFAPGSSARTVLQAVGQYVGSHLNDHLAAIPAAPGAGNSWSARPFDPRNVNALLNVSNLAVPADTIIIYAGASGLPAGTVGEGGTGYSVSGSVAWNQLIKARGQAGALASPQTDVGPWGGSITFDKNTLFDFASLGSPPSSNGVSFVAVALHEIGHVLGLIPGTSAYGLVNHANNTFLGRHSVASYGGPVPLDFADAHWAPGTTSFGLPAIMDPAVLSNPQGPKYTSLDWAALEDAGWETNSLSLSTAPPSSVAPGAGFGLAVSGVDPNGRVDTAYNGPIFLTLANNPGGATLGGALQATAVKGVATFSGLTIPKSGNGYTIRISTNDDTPPIVSSAINVKTTANFNPSVDFVIRSDNQVYARHLDASGNPTGAYYLIGPKQVTGLAAVRLGATTNFEAFVIGLDAQVYAETITGATLSGYFAAAYGSVASISAGTDAAGNPLVFAVGTDHQLYEQKFNSSGNPTSGSYVKAAYGDFKSAVLTHDASGNPLLFAVGQDGQVYGLKMNASGTPNGGLFKMASGGVKQLAVGADASGKPEVFVVGLDDYAYGLKTDGAGSPSGGYFGFGGPVKSISVGSDASARPLVFAVGTDNRVYVHKFDAGGTPVGPFFGAAAGLASSIAAGNDANGNPELFAVLTTDNQVYVAPFDPTGTSNGPFAFTTTGAVKKVVVA